jgi:putative hydrolase of the HAD superfamily
MINKEKIKGIIFDWGGVCCKEGEPFSLGALQSKLCMNPDEITKKAEDIHIGYYEGKYKSEEFWRAIMKFFNLEQGAAINPRTLSSAYLNSYQIYPEIFDLILRLKKKYKIGLLSNLTPEMRDHIRAKHGLRKYFHVEIYSCDENVKALKPSYKPFEAALEALKLEPADCLFIDNSQKNIRAAEELGMRVILFENISRFLEETESIFG